MDAQLTPPLAILASEQSRPRGRCLSSYAPLSSSRCCTSNRRRRCPPSRPDIGLAIKIYEQVRKARGEAVQASALEVRTALHLPDGLEQRERDDKIRLAGQGKGNNPDL